MKANSCYTVKDNQLIINGLFSQKHLMSIDKQQVSTLSDSDIWDIQAHFDRALDTNSGSGDHWILMACLNQHGFRTNGTEEAMRLAEEIIITWHQIQI